MVSRQEKFIANKGVGDHILELIKTDPKGFCRKDELVKPVLKEFPLADSKTVGNALTNLAKKNLIFKAPSTKGMRGVRWCPVKELKPLSQQPPSGPVGPEFNAKQVGEAVITAIQNMAKRIKEQDDRVDRLLNTLSNRQASWKKTEEELRSKIIDKNKIIESLQMQLEPDPDMVFKLADIANFTGDKHDQGKT